jgi:transposase
MCDSPPTFERYLAADLHKVYVMVGGVNARQAIVLPPRRIELAAWPKWARANLKKTDALVVESTSNAWDFYDLVAPLVGHIVVANPRLVKLIAGGHVKTDKIDTLALAKLLAANMIPPVWVPPLEVREARGLLAHRRRLVQHRTRLMNRLQSVLQRHNLPGPTGGPFSAENRAWWDALKVSPTERLRIRQDLATLDHLAGQITEAEAEVLRLTTSAPWAAQVPFVIQLPGFSALLTMTVLAAIGDIRRFPSAKKLVGYSGLGARVHDSGQTHKTGRITKTGRRELRWALVEAAWIAVRYSAHWQAEFEQLAGRMPQNQAIVAIARQLLVTIWHVLSKQVADQHADEQRVATKLIRWSWKLTPADRAGLSTRLFVRQVLQRLKLGATLTHLTYGKKPRRIATLEELRAALSALTLPGSSTA